MINWLVILAFVIIGLLIIRIGHIGKKTKLIVVAIIIILIYVSATTILNKNNITLNSVDGVGKAISVYFSWIGNSVKNIWQVSGEVIKTIGNAIGSNSTSV